MKATVLLADAASDATGGKVSALGLGWSQTGVPTSPMAVIVLVDVGWDETNRDLAIAVELLDADGHPVRHLGSGGGPAPVRIDAKAQVGRPPGLPPGTPIRVPITVSIGPGLPLQPGQTYQWRVSIEGYDEATASESFWVRRSA